MLCPHCGCEFAPPSDPDNFDDVTESVRANDSEWIKLTPNEWDILQILRSRIGRCVSYGMLYDALYGASGERVVEGIKVYKLKIQRKLRGSRFEIRTFPGRGYGLIERGATK